ncbi:MAG: thioesterase domain-containing protein, partial [Psychrosphaera sp.]|nr:thioesterase domain-containing protein [Psychrosphaera sp.]
MDVFPHTPSGKADRKVLMQQRVEITSAQQYVAPQTPTQVQLAQIWQDVLTVTRIGLHDDFYDLGGHSLLAIVLVNKINQRFNSKLSVHHLLQNKNIDALSSLIAINPLASKTSDHIVPLSAAKVREDKDAPKVFFVHGIGGNVISFYPLVNDIDKGPVQASVQTKSLDCYGVESLGYNTGGTLYATADEMIEQYTNAIKQTQAEGPYHIVGWSYGSMVAKQIVRKLLEQGHEVQSFISIDAQAPDPQQLKTRFGQFQGDNLTQINDSDIQDLMGLYENMFDHQPAQDQPVLNQLCDLLGFAPTDCDKQKQQYAKMTFSHLSNAGQFCPSPIAP